MLFILNSCFLAVHVKIYNVLFQELELYKPELVGKPAILIFNKLDTEGSEELCDDTIKKVKCMRGEHCVFL